MIEIFSISQIHMFRYLVNQWWQSLHERSIKYALTSDENKFVITNLLQDCTIFTSTIEDITWDNCDTVHCIIYSVQYRSVYSAWVLNCIFRYYTDKLCLGKVHKIVVITFCKKLNKKDSQVLKNPRKCSTMQQIVHASSVCQILLYMYCTVASKLYMQSNLCCSMKTKTIQMFCVYHAPVLY